MDLRTGHRKSLLAAAAVVVVVVLHVKHNHRKVPSMPRLAHRKAEDVDACGVVRAWQESSRWA